MIKGIKKFIFFVFLSILFVELFLQAAGFILNLKPHRKPSPKSSFNIVCIGDSFTYGYGASEQYSYPRQLERLLRQEYKQADISVINLAVAGYNTSLCLKVLKTEFNNYHPKVVLVMAGFNNCWNLIDSGYFDLKSFKDRHPVKYRLRNLDEFLLHSKIYRLLKICYFNLSAGFRKEAATKNPPASKEQELPPAAERSPMLNDLILEGKRYYATGQFAKAEEYCLKALALGPQDYDPHWLKGRLLFLRGEVDAGRKEMILALKYAWNPEHVADILADMQDRQQPRSSQDSKYFSELVTQLRPLWVSKFGENYVQRFVDPQVFTDYDILSSALINDFREMRDFLKENNARLVVLTYPLPSTKFRLAPDIYQRVSRQLQLSLVDNAEVFNKFLLKLNYAELFSEDGHCTSQGYRIIAENTLAGLKKYNLLPVKKEH